MPTNWNEHKPVFKRLPDVRAADFSTRMDDLEAECHEIVKVLALIRRVVPRVLALPEAGAVNDIVVEMARCDYPRAVEVLHDFLCRWSSEETAAIMELT